jgi:hypothetical protein
MSRHKLFRSHAAECIRLAETLKSDELWSILQRVPLIVVYSPNA